MNWHNEDPSSESSEEERQDPPPDLPGLEEAPSTELGLEDLDPPVDSPEESEDQPEEPEEDSPASESDDKETPEEGSEEDKPPESEDKESDDDGDSDGDDGDDSEKGEEEGDETPESEEPDVDPFDVQDLGEVDLEKAFPSLDEVGRTRMTEFLGKVQADTVAKQRAANEKSELADHARVTMEATEARFKQAINSLGAEGNAEAAAQAELYRQQEHINGMMTKDINATAWWGFTTAYGKAYEKLPRQAKVEFGKIIRGWSEGEGDAAVEHPSTLMSMGGNDAHMGQRLEVALGEACKLAGCSMPRMYEGIEGFSVRSEEERTEAKKQAAIADGTTPPTDPTRSYEETSYEELMGRHDHLLND